MVYFFVVFGTFIFPPFFVLSDCFLGFKKPPDQWHNADSCDGMVIENSYITVGDDGIAIKSGWDQYGIQYGKPSKNIIIRNVVLRTTVR